MGHGPWDTRWGPEQFQSLFKAVKLVLRQIDHDLLVLLADGVQHKQEILISTVSFRSQLDFFKYIAS